MIRHIVTPGLDIAVAGKLNEIVEPRVFDEVLSSARTGDVAALGEMYRFYQPSLVRYLRANAPDAADDLASETWLDVAGGLERFSGGEPDFRRWLFTIARRRLLDDRRRIIRRRMVIVERMQSRQQRGNAERARQGFKGRGRFDFDQKQDGTGQSLLAQPRSHGFRVAQADNGKIQLFAGARLGAIAILGDHDFIAFAFELLRQAGAQHVIAFAQKNSCRHEGCAV